jgi:hypothetical protein
MKLTRCWPNRRVVIREDPQAVSEYVAEYIISMSWDPDAVEGIASAYYDPQENEF